MGFSSVTAQIIMFIAVMGFATGMVAVFNNYIDENTGAMNAQWQVMSNNLKTDITITNVDWDNTTKTTTVYVLNTGKTTLDPANTDIYLDGMFIPRDNNNRTIQVSPSTEIKNTGLWDPKEILEVQVFFSVEEGSHYVDVGSQFGVKDSETFTA